MGNRVVNVIFGGLIGVAALTTLVRSDRKTSQVIQAIGSSFSQMVKAAQGG